VAGSLPASEGDLLRSRPGSNRPGVFPPGALLAEEKIVYETRPRLMGLHPALVLAPLPFAFLFGAAIVVGVAQGVGGTGFAIAGVIVVLLILSPALYGVYDWRRTAYVITDQRVAVRSGDSYETATFEMVRNVSLAPDSSKVVFELLPPPDAPPRAGFRLSRKSRLVWVGLEGAPAVASFGQSAIEYYRLQNQQRLLRQSLVVSSMSNTVVCAYCGALVDLSSGSGSAPRCPKCSAFLTVAPSGL
jgi:hypothetical protein